MDPVYSVFIIFAIVWVGFCLLSIVKVLNKGLDLKRSAHALNAAIWQIRNERENSNLALINDLRSFLRIAWKKDQIKEEEDPEKDPEEEKEEETK